MIMIRRKVLKRFRILSFMDKRRYFLKVFKKAEKKYGKHDKRLAGEGWGADWKTLIATIMSAQSRDETTIPIAEKLFRKYKSLKSLARANYGDVLRIFKSLNYNRTKAKNVIAAAKFIISEFHGKIADKIEELVKIPGVGRKTANLVITECHDKEGVCIDTHCHRILNVLGIVHTKNPLQTEMEIRKIAPREYWSRLNRILVLWGKEIRGHDKNKILAKLDEPTS